MTAATDIAKAERKLAKLEAELEELREEYRDVQERQRVELRHLEKRAQELTERIESGRNWLGQHTEGGE